MGKKSNPFKFRVTKEGFISGPFFALFVRWCVASYPYSGYNSPPMYGDYEAQRHWQEITLHTQVKYWYHNTTQNDLQYWGLDYPPLTAYHSLLMGLVADWLDPESVRLFASRGYESDSHKTFMRWTVFLSDLYFYVTAVLCLGIDLERVKPKDETNVFKRADLSSVLMLLYPGLILIDHGHFQYNCVSLGLFLWATFFIVAIENDIMATIFFTLAINYKQMELYHSLPFFFYLLKKCFVHVPHKGKLMSFILNLNKLAIAVISIFIFVWYPFMHSWKDILQVVHRLFPFSRGVFEDKVSNFWCLINVLVKLKKYYSHDQMAQLCLTATAAVALPSCVDLFVRHNKKKFILSLINVSLAFFLFSFQVHEKTILLVAIPVALHMPEDPFMCFWFLLVSTFSMLPLLVKDGLILPFVLTNLIYMIFFSICVQVAQPSKRITSIFDAYTVYNCITPNKLINSLKLKFLSALFKLSVLLMVVLTIGIVFMKPLQQYPDLLPLLISVYSCGHFILFLIYFYYKQFCTPKSEKPKGKMN